MSSKTVASTTNDNQEMAIDVHHIFENISTPVWGHIHYGPIPAVLSYIFKNMMHINDIMCVCYVNDWQGGC